MDNYGIYKNKIDFQRFSRNLYAGWNVETQALGEIGGFRADYVNSVFSFIDVTKYRASPFKAEKHIDVSSRSIQPEFYSLHIFGPSPVQLCQNGRHERLELGGTAVLDSRLPGSAAFYKEILGSCLNIPVKMWTRVAPPPRLESAYVVQERSVAGRMLRLFTTEIANSDTDTAASHQEILVRQLIELASLCLTDSAVQISGSLQRQIRTARIKEFIRRNYHNANLDPCLIAREFNISTRLLSGLFSDLDESVMTYVWSVRLVRAAELLLSGEKGWVSVKEICYMVGFKYPSHFSLAFRNKYGVSPNQYRLRMKDASVTGILGRDRSN